MDFSGKLTERLRLPRQLNVSGVMATEIKLRAQYAYRGVEDQIRYLLMLGIRYEDELLGKETTRTDEHQRTLFGT